VPSFLEEEGWRPWDKRTQIWEGMEQDNLAWKGVDDRMRYAVSSELSVWEGSNRE
jgi:hypothetical protein